MYMSDDKWKKEWLSKINEVCGGSKLNFSIKDSKGEDNRENKTLTLEKTIGFEKKDFEFNTFYNRKAMERYMDSLIDYCERKQIGLQFDFILP